MIYLLIVLHFLSDFILQTRKIAENKSSDYRYMLVHMAIIYMVFGTFSWYFGIPQGIPLTYTILHGLQDTYIWSWFKKYVNNRADSAVYIEYNCHVKDNWFWNTIAIDQSIHICLLISLFTWYF